MKKLPSLKVKPKSKIESKALRVLTALLPAIAITASGVSEAVADQLQDVRSANPADYDIFQPEGREVLGFSGYTNGQMECVVTADPEYSPHKFPQVYCDNGVRPDIGGTELEPIREVSRIEFSDGDVLESNFDYAFLHQLVYNGEQLPFAYGYHSPVAIETDSTKSIVSVFDADLDSHSINIAVTNVTGEEPVNQGAPVSVPDSVNLGENARITGLTLNNTELLVTAKSDSGAFVLRLILEDLDNITSSTIRFDSKVDTDAEYISDFIYIGNGMHAGFIDNQFSTFRFEASTPTCDDFEPVECSAITTCNGDSVEVTSQEVCSVEDGELVLTCPVPEDFVCETEELTCQDFQDMLGECTTSLVCDGQTITGVEICTDVVNGEAVIECRTLISECPDDTCRPGEGDIDGDCIDDFSDNCSETPNQDQADLNNDGLGDVCDPDIDGDGVSNNCDGAPRDASNSINTCEDQCPDDTPIVFKIDQRDGDLETITQELTVESGSCDYVCEDGSKIAGIVMVNQDTCENMMGANDCPETVCDAICLPADGAVCETNTEVPDDKEPEDKEPEDKQPEEQPPVVVPNTPKNAGDKEGGCTIASLEQQGDMDPKQLALLVGLLAMGVLRRRRK